MPRKYKRKTQRKTRLAKLNVGLPSDLLRPEVDLDEPKWESIQSAYGVVLSIELRNSILGILNGYLWQDQAEAYAPYLRDGLVAVERIKKSTDFFIDSINAISDPAGKYALSVVNACLNKRTISLVPSLAAYSVACAEAGKRLRHDSAGSGFREGQAWRLMIRKLFNIAKESNLPCTVAKPNTRQRTEFRPSPFVKFIKALQDQLPNVHWHPPKTMGALSTAISLVRSDRAKYRSRLPQGAGGE
jgi:hypothetical protein